MSPYEEYIEFLHEMNVTLYPHRAHFAAKVVEGKGSFRIWLHKGEDIEKYAISGHNDDERQELSTLLGGEPKTLMSLDVSTLRESQAVVVKFAAMIADHYPCVVLSHTSNTYYTSDELIDLRSRGEGFDGFNWQQMEENRRLRELEDAQEAQEEAQKEDGEDQ